MTIERAKVSPSKGCWLFMTEGGIARLVQHPLSPFKKRAIFAIAILGLLMAVGTIGMMILEGWDLVTSFYFMSLLATAEGPAQSPMTVGGKIFASFLAFLSIGAAISAITFTFGPFVWLYIQRGLRLCRERRGQTEDKTRAQGPSPFICRLRGIRLAKTHQ